MSEKQATSPLILSAEEIAATPSEGFDGPVGGNVTWKTLLSSGKTPTDTFTTGIATCKVGSGYLQHHRHTHPEIYHVISGRGVVAIDGVEHIVGKGSVVFIPGDAEHGIKNMSGQEELVWLYVFAAERFENVEYRFSEGREFKAKL